jgi:pimeloyl-ACP methyl ester carboxylesterase
MRRHRGAFILVTVSALVLAAVAPSAPVAAATTPRVALHSCDLDGAKCGSITRPLDPTDPSAGTVPIGFEFYAHTDRTRPSLGTIVAVEGGPGYATRESRDSYLTLFEPLLGRRNLLLVDNRGTGSSGAIDCKKLQSYTGDYNTNVGTCGRQLGATSDVYGTAFAADDLAAVLDALRISKVDLYGDSYGTFFSQAFAIRHPNRLRTLILDAAYPVEGQDPWYRDLNRALRDAWKNVCARDPGCTNLGGDPLARLRTLADRLRAHPLTGSAPDADGEVHRITVDAGMVAYLAASATYGFGVYRELDAAGRAYLDDGDPKPLLRVAVEQWLWGDAGDVAEFSEGLYVADICNDYPQLWDISSPIASRPAQYQASVASLRAREPNAFAPFSFDDWLNSPWTEYQSCINWPAPSNFVFPVPTRHHYPNVPTLVLSGDLDSITSSEGAHAVANRFPNSTFVAIRNGVHVMAISDYSRCASDIVVRFVATQHAGNTSCASKYNEVRTVDEFPTRLDDAPGATKDERLANVTMNTVADLFPRWFAMFGEEGVGLRGGRFDTTGFDDVDFTLHGLRWVENVAVDGTAHWDRTTGAITAHVVARAGPHLRGTFDLTWNDWDRHALARVRGTVNTRSVNESLLAN